MSRELAPVALFVYNRLEHAKRTIECLKNNHLAQETDLFIFSDGPKKKEDEEKIRLIRDFIYNISGFKSVHIIESKENKGLANSIISGVNKVISEYGKIIVVEDDLLTSECFLNYMNDALDFYKKNECIMQITGNSILTELPLDYKESVYTFYRSWSHSWATWKDRWDLVDWKVQDYPKYRFNIFKVLHFCKCGTDVDKMLRLQMKGQINSWAIRFCYTQSKLNKLTLFPRENLVNNIGFDGSGIHCGSGTHVENALSKKYEYTFSDNISVNKTICKKLQKRFNRSIIRRIRRILKKKK